MALPTHVLMWSAVSRKLWTFIAECAAPCKTRQIQKDEAPSGSKARMVPGSLTLGSGLLPGFGVLAELVVVGHAPVDDDVLFPLHRALGELLLGLDDLREHGIARRLLG